MSSHFSHFAFINSNPDRLKDQELNPVNWHWLFNLGLAFLLSGLLAIAMPQLVTTALNLVLGAILLFIGLISSLYAYQVSAFSKDYWPLFTAISLLVTGFLLLLFPKVGALSLTLIIAIFFIFSGVGKIALAQLVSPHSSRHWIMLSGLVDLGLSFFIFFNLVDTADWFLGVLLGISLILQGLWNIRLARVMQKDSRIILSEI